MLGCSASEVNQCFVSGLSGDHQRGNIDPQRIVAHLDWLVKGEGLVFQMEPQPREGLRITVEELGCLAAYHPIERGHALLPVEQQLDAAGGDRAIAPSVCRLRLRHPYEKTTYRMPTVKRIEQAAHLVAVPHVAALELGQRHIAAIDQIEDSRDLHRSSPFVMVGNGARLSRSEAGF